LRRGRRSRTLCAWWSREKSRCSSVLTSPRLACWEGKM
jgi:hypothetical protein